MVEVTVHVDATTALARFSPAGIPEQVRRNLRSVIPGLTRKLGALVDAKLDSEFKSRRRLAVKKEMVENQRSIIGRVAVVWTGDKRAGMVPAVLDTGAKAHIIRPKNAKALAFFWPQMGRNVFFKEVHHPGFPGRFYMRNALAEMSGEIQETISRSVMTAAARR